MPSQRVLTIDVPIQRTADWEHWALLSSDWHWDNPKCRRDLLKKHLDQALERNADVFGFGDVMCLMQGKYDPRGVKSDVRPEHNVANYLDAVIEDFASWLDPWKSILRRLTPGNHETNVLKRLETDPLQRAVALLRHAGSPVEGGGYQGYTRMKFFGETWRRSVRIKHHHGHGGGGIVTKGTLWPVRRAAVHPDANIHVSGHIHESWLFPITRERITSQGLVYSDQQLHLCSPGYKDETLCSDGWPVEKGMSPRPLGAWWVRFFWDRAGGSEFVRYEAMQAS